MLDQIPTEVTTYCRAPTDLVSSCELFYVMDCIAYPIDFRPCLAGRKPPTRPLRRPSRPWRGTLRPRRSNGDVHAIHAPPQASQPLLALPSRSSMRAFRLNPPAQDRTFHLALQRRTPRRAYPPLKPAPRQQPKPRERGTLSSRHFPIWDAAGSHGPRLATSITDKYVAQARPPRPGV